MDCVYSQILISLFLCLTVCPSRCNNVKVFSGQNVTLPCKYNLSYHGKCEICWMRGDIPYSGCGDEIIASDGDVVVRQASQRYQLNGELHRGDASLTILSTTPEDSGKYGCLVQVPGLFNDEKIIVNLIIMKEPLQTEVNSLLPSTTELVTMDPWHTELVTMDPWHTGPTHENNIAVKKQKNYIIPITVIPILLIFLGFGTFVFLICKYIYTDLKSLLYAFNLRRFVSSRKRKERIALPFKCVTTPPTVHERAVKKDAAGICSRDSLRPFLADW
ncbi:T-cell immunoglobulin and mucin domain-containing protein 4-like [Clarias gariepinus]|uniref:T-cell immunoglobulin and mucin domain-containing protein 4-like n=1 Tax=Clarias gariepinus TaxID=13013 RepID=UPI00234E02B3|nr:T-cell immunoglobulin and mucin domain-containing protein 4-like [Clarias gariepinus]